MYPTSRSITNAVEDNTYLLSLRLKDEKCPNSIFEAYEKQVHLNRRWDYIHSSGRTIANESDNCREAIRLIDEANKAIENYIQR
jgi:predicted DNA binding protein